MSSRILITGGLGYIGSHTVLNFLQNTQHKVIVIDNCSNSSLEILSNIENLTQKKITFYKADVGDYSSLVKIFSKEKIDSVIHFAAAKSVSDSIRNPEYYYQNNLLALLVLLRAMRFCGVKKIIFSSSATVYSSSNKFPVNEEGILGYQNPYGQTKLVGEDILIREQQQSGLSVNILRYFNPLGNESSGSLGDKVSSTATNIMPMILKALHQKKEFFIYGTDYPTKDGSPIRDYIHVCDLADAHRLAYDSLQENPECIILNVGLGSGVSVLDLITTFNEVNHVKIQINHKTRREGDLPICFSNTDKIKAHLSWDPCYDLTDMCRDAYSFYKKQLTIGNI